MTRILLVDDTRLLAELDGTVLARESFDVQVAPSAADIPRLAREVQPAVIVIGEGENCPDALDVCRGLRADPATRAAGIIYLGTALNRERALGAGADVFIPRPYTRLELREAFLRVLRLRDRIALRRAVDLPVELATGQDVVRGTCRDLSLSGAFVVAERDLAPGQTGTLHFEAGGRPFRLPVEVVRRGRGASAEPGIGVSFVGLEPDTGAFLSRFVRTVAPPRPPGGNGRPGPAPGGGGGAR